MVIAEELNIDDLKSMYSESMLSSDNLPEEVLCDGLEHGSQRYFDEIIRAQRGTENEISPAEENGQDFARELVRALAREITVRRRKAESVFAHIDEEPKTAPSCLIR